MVELKVSLEFACCHCCEKVGLTVKCKGKGLAAGMPAVAAVSVPCPYCQAINQVYFDPCGTVHAVAPHQVVRTAVPAPSWN